MAPFVDRVSFAVRRRAKQREQGPAPGLETRQQPLPPATDGSRGPLMQRHPWRASTVATMDAGIEPADAGNLMSPTLPFTARPARVRRPVLGAVLVVVGISVPLGILLLTMADAYRTTFGAAAPLTFAARLGSGLLTFTLLVAGVVVGRRIVGIGAALRQPDAVTVLTADSRRPVLYLRSFDDDAVPDTTESAIPLGAVQTIEMRLARAFWDMGPVISIGRPGERLPELGTSRIYVADDVWQRAVQHFLEQAAAVVILVGRSTGVTWEIQTALATVPREKLLFAFPFLLPRAARRGRWARERIRPRGRGDDRVSSALLGELRREQEARYLSFREHFGTLFDVNLPDRLEGEVFLDFLANGPRLLPRREPLFIRRRRDSQGITLDYLRTLRPFIEKLQGRTIPPDATERFFTSRRALGSLTGACAALAAVLFFTPLWTGFSPVGAAVFFLTLVPANLAYLGTLELPSANPSFDDGAG